MSNPATVEQIARIMSGDLTVEDLVRLRERKQARRAMGRRQAELEQEYAKKSTRELLALYRSVRWRMAGSPEYWALKKVLATRPHVWRREQGRRYRQRLAKKFHGQSKGRDR